MAVSSAPASSLSSHDPSITYDTIDFNDRKQVVAARNTMIREQWIKTMEQRLVRDELARCYKSEGVNHYVTCKHLADRTCRG
ncbi:hypothetical protein BCR37DRAFT_122653 [Protomyces lactucae-debilis]|uniref:NADH-ubiquinone oxidoreductase 12 kDa subunit n=1 Tax=Protomyces lactucae-debilis TaxID=2754530 RepID=A0A1Y2F1N9_PROLT|nr:uncharacterized protein BCR37DRAFT_122653 [Protomyces lactucae-debilis]ORY77798.1 hypothetical protein BCR37DRAFT_122653 [Protomyces lactucae-debilis]